MNPPLTLTLTLLTLLTLPPYSWGHTPFPSSLPASWHASATHAPCSDVITTNATSVLLTDGDGAYANFQRCGWMLTRREPYAFLTLFFQMMQLECGWDYLLVYEAGDGPGGPLVGAFSGSFVPPPLLSVSGGLAVFFVSDAYVTDLGIQVQAYYTFCPYNCYFRGECVIAGPQHPDVLQGARVCACEQGYRGLYCQHRSTPGDAKYAMSSFANGSCDRYACIGPSSVSGEIELLQGDMFESGEIATLSRILPEPCLSFPWMLNISNLGLCTADDAASPTASIADEFYPHQGIAPFVPLAEGSADGIAWTAPVYQENANAPWLILACPPVQVQDPPPQQLSASVVALTVIVTILLGCVCFMGAHVIASRNAYILRRNFLPLTLLPHTPSYNPDDIDWYTVCLDEPGESSSGGPTGIRNYFYRANGDVARAVTFVVLSHPPAPAPAPDDSSEESDRDEDGSCLHARIGSLTLATLLTTPIPPPDDPYVADLDADTLDNDQSILDHDQNDDTDSGSVGDDPSAPLLGP